MANLKILFFSLLVLFSCNFKQENKTQIKASHQDSYTLEKLGQVYIDSLLLRLVDAKEDTNKVNLLNELSISYNLIKPDEGIKFGEESILT